jgi:hypothetical protein
VKDAAAAGAPLDPQALLVTAIGTPLVPTDVDGIADLNLPGDHPPWQRDLVSISTRVRAVLATLKPLVVRVVSFWDHVRRSATIDGNRSLEIDPSGSYRLSSRA